jgi:glycosyltransferase involved in cell wall biosynthesis
VQRALKFAKYLPQFGWRPLIVANGRMTQDQVTKVQDHSLLRDLPAECVVRYTTTTPREMRRAQAAWRNHLAATDSMGWWVPPAIRTGMELLREHGASAILVTLSPFSAAQAGLRLKAMSGLPLILDLRDPWALDETKIYSTRWHAWRDWRAMARALSAANLVIMNTPEAATAVQAAFALPPTTRVISLTNGFDADDFGQSAKVMITPAPRDVLRIVHTGMFHSELARVWDDLLSRRGLINRLKHARRPINLWTRTPRYLLQALQRSRIPPDKVELVLAGELSKADQALIDASPLRGRIKILGYQSHEQSLAWVSSADVLFLPLHTPLDGKPALVTPGKTYEYIASGRPILAMGPPGDMRRFITQTRCGIAVDGDDVVAAQEAIESFYEAKLAGRRPPTPNAAALAPFERRELTKRLAEELDALQCPREPTPLARQAALNL